MNALANNFHSLNGQIQVDSPNKSPDALKIAYTKKNAEDLIGRSLILNKFCT
jgi:hypothetical protein